MGLRRYADFGKDQSSIAIQRTETSAREWRQRTGGCSDRTNFRASNFVSELLNSDFRKVFYARTVNSR